MHIHLNFPVLDSLQNSCYCYSRKRIFTFLRFSSRVLKTLEFSKVRNKSENSDVFNLLDDIYLVFNEKKYIFFFIGYMSHPLKKEVLNMQKRKKK